MLKRLLNVRRKHTWRQPEGYDTGIKIYNCTTKTKVPLITQHKNLIKWYTCGPTVYDSSHVGHACCYMKLDIIQKILKNHFAQNVVSVLNITDIDDKIIKRGAALKLRAEEVAEKYEAEFWDDLNALGIEKPLLILRVVENMELIKNFIATLLKNNQAYKAADDSIYFDVSKDCDYGRLLNVGVPEEKSSIKKSAMDFALWKSPKPGEPYWESEWGPGRPGWHIECSALASSIFGSTLDVHCGGIDLRFPHHENEEAQSCAFHAKPQWVNYWIHIGELQLNNFVKMSKSLQNTVSIKSLLEKSTADAFRMACLQSHYRSSMEYSEELLVTAENNLNKFRFLLNDCNAYLKGTLKANVNPNVLSTAINETATEIDAAFKDDFNTPNVIKTLNNLTSLTNKMLHNTSTTHAQNEPPNKFYILAIVEIVLNTLNNCGINLRDAAKKSTTQDVDFSAVMDILNDFRSDVRNFGIQSKNGELLKICDKVRSDVSGLGIKINDYGRKSEWIK